jgi:hypothetical protein
MPEVVRLRPEALKADLEFWWTSFRPAPNRRVEVGYRLDVGAQLLGSFCCQPARIDTGAPVPLQRLGGRIDQRPPIRAERELSGRRQQWSRFGTSFLTC